VFWKKTVKFFISLVEIIFPQRAVLRTELCLNSNSETSQSDSTFFRSASSVPFCSAANDNFLYHFLIAPEPC